MIVISLSKDSDITKCAEIISSNECLNKKFDTLVNVTEMNKTFINEFMKYIKYDEFIDDIFCKQGFRYEDLDVLIDRQMIVNDFENPNEIQSEISFLLYDQAKKYKYFNAKEFPTKFIKYLTLNKNTEDGKSYSELLTNKNILIFDDVNQEDNNVSDDVLAINRNYMPASITVIRLI